MIQKRKNGKGGRRRGKIEIVCYVSVRMESMIIAALVPELSGWKMKLRCLTGIEGRTLESPTGGDILQLDSKNLISIKINAATPRSFYNYFKCFQLYFCRPLDSRELAFICQVLHLIVLCIPHRDQHFSNYFLHHLRGQIFWVRFRANLNWKLWLLWQANLSHLT